MLQEENENATISYWLNTERDTLISEVARQTGRTYKYGLSQNYPNPFNPATTITYTLPENGMVTIKVYDILGREIAVLTDGLNTSGSHSVVWSGKDSKGRDVSSGVYFYNIKFKDQTVVKMMLMLK